MKCRRICRELLWLARFGEFGPSSQPHLDHLAGCRGCRDEVGFDRAMVEQLRIALAERIADSALSPSAFDRIWARAQVPEPRPAARIWEWSTGLIGRLRFATAMAGTGLALVLALNMNVVPVTVPASSGANDAESAALQQVPRMLPARSSLAELIRAWGGSDPGATRPDPEAALTVAGRVPTARSDDDGIASSSGQTELRLVVRAVQVPDMGGGASATVAAVEPASASDAAGDRPPGQPS
jgi:hypothetical protein